MSDSTESSAHFFRIITLVVDVGTETLLDTFYSKVPKADVPALFSTPAIIKEFDRLQRKHVLNKVQYEKLTVSPDPDKYDITLLLTLLTNEIISGISPPTGGWRASQDPTDFSLAADLIRLREKRNDLVGHRPNTQLELSDFKNYWGNVETLLVRIAASVSAEEEAKIKQKIRDAGTRMLDPLNDREKKLLQVFLQWRKDDDEKNQAKLLEVQTSLESLHLKVDNIPTSPTPIDETDAVRSNDTLSSLQSQVISLAQGMGTMAQQDAVQEIHKNVQSMQDMMNNLSRTVEMLRKQLDDKRGENERFKEEIRQLRQSPPSDVTRTPAMYRGPSQSIPKKPKISNPNAMTEKEISDISRQIGYEWEQLRIYLDFTEAQGHALKRTYDDDVLQRIHVMLKSWHDVVAECGENPRMLLAAAFVNAATNYSMAYKLVPKKSFDANATAKESTVERIQEITFSRRGQYYDQRDGSFHKTGRDSPYGYGGGHGAVNVFGGDVRIEGRVAIGSSSSSASMVSSDGLGGGQGSINVYDGKVVMGASSDVVIGPPATNYPAQSYTTAVRGEGLDVTDFGAPSNNSAASSGQPLKKEYDDTLSQGMVGALNEQMKSVGILVSRGEPVGTVFRVGTNCVMTALHVIRAVVDPACSGDADMTRLVSDDTYINFNESALTSPVVPYKMKTEFIFNVDLDIAVLEISNPSNLPMKMNLCKPKLFQPSSSVTSVSLIGYGHTNHIKKCLDPKCGILSPTSQRIKSALAWLQQNLSNYKFVMEQASQNPELVDTGYHGYDHPSKILFDCFMEHGASGAPALTNNNERSVEVVGILTHGLPEFYFKLPPQLQANFPKNYRLEIGAKMTSVYEWIKSTQPDSLVKDLFY